MIVFRASVKIRRDPEAVFYMLANIHSVQQAEGSPVLALEMTTPGPPGLGSRYREVVRMLPFYNGEILSEITAFEPPLILEMGWTGPGMTGRDRYELARIQEGAELVHQKWTSFRGMLGIMEPLMSRALLPRLQSRLEDIKRVLEEGSDGADAEEHPVYP